VAGDLCGGFCSYFPLSFEIWGGNALAFCVLFWPFFLVLYCFRAVFVTSPPILAVLAWDSGGFTLPSPGPVLLWLFLLVRHRFFFLSLSTLAKFGRPMPPPLFYSATFHVFLLKRVSGTPSPSSFKQSLAGSPSYFGMLLKMSFVPALPPPFYLDTPYFRGDQSYFLLSPF